MVCANRWSPAFTGLRAEISPVGELRQRRDEGVVVGVEEQRERIALLAHLADAMRGGRELAVGPDLHHVADVDDVGAGHRRRVDPFSGAVHDLEAGSRRAQQREALVVRVSADAGAILGAGVERIVDQPKLARRLGDVAIEVFRLLADGHGEAAQQDVAELEHGGVVVVDRFSEARQVGPLVRSEQAGCRRRSQDRWPEDRWRDRRPPSCPLIPRRRPPRLPGT